MEFGISFFHLRESRPSAVKFFDLHPVCNDSPVGCSDQVGERDGLHVFIELVGFAAGMDDFQFIELECLHVCPHGFRDPGSIVELAFESDAPAILEKEQIEFGVALR